MCHYFLSVTISDVSEILHFSTVIKILFVLKVSNMIEYL